MSMNYRPLGTTGITVSEIGFGTWGIGGITENASSYGRTDDDTSMEALRSAFDRGITFYDTADIYGYGHSEELVGKVFERSRDKIVIATKVGFQKHGGPHDFSSAHIRKSLENSLIRLRTDYIDIYQLHSPSIELLKNDSGILETFRQLQKEGKFRILGISLKNPDDGFSAIHEFGFNVVQVNFNMIDQRILTNNFYHTVESVGAGIIARTPLAFGFLSGKIKNLYFPPEDHRSAWPIEQLSRWNEAPKLFSVINKNKKRSLTQLALKFCLQFGAVSTVIPGMMTAREVEENSAVSDLQNLSPDELNYICTLYQTKKFFIKH